MSKLNFFMKSKGPGLFDQDNRARELRAKGRGILALDELINWESFRTMIEEATHKERKGNQGRPGFHPFQMFKVLIIQSFYNLSDQRMEDMLLDSESFKIFCGFSYGDKLPDEKTIWRFREQMKNAGVFEKLLKLLQDQLSQQEIVGQAGVIVDATFVQVRKQHNTKEENEAILKGEIPESFKSNPNKLRQKDLDARWGAKNSTSYYGYKAHIKADIPTKLVMHQAFTPAHVHDSQPLFSLLNKDDKNIFADSAYQGAEIKRKILDMNLLFNIHERAYRNTPLMEYQIFLNKLYSSIRAKVEHVFGDITMGMQGFFCRYVGRNRVYAASQFKLFLYNVRRLSFYLRKQQQAKACLTT